MTASEASLRELLQGILNDSDDTSPPSRISPLDIATLTPNKFDGDGQARFQALLDHAQPIYVTDADGYLSAYSRAFAEIHNEVFAAGGSFNALICELRANDAEIRQSNTAVIAGETHHFLSRHYPLRDNHGNLIGFGGVYDDISALAQSGRKASEMESWLQDVIRSASDWIWSMDRNCNLTFASPRISEILEEPSQAILGRHLFSLGSFEADDVVAAKTMRDIELRAPFRGRKFLLTNRKGEKRHILLSAVPIFDDERGAFCGYRGVGTDITDKVESEKLIQASATKLEETFTELHQRNEELQVALDHARTADKSKLDFLAMMSHELKTPLNGIIGFSDAAIQKIHGPVPPAYEEYFQHIHKAGHHLLAIINDLLDVSSMGRDDLAVDIAPAPIGELIQEAVSLVNFGTGRDKLDISALTPRTNLYVRCDHLRIRQIIVNLLSNALKFTPDQGKIGIDIERRSNGMVAITVWDTGIGIPADQQERVFEKFYQVEKNILSRGTPGTGLGLSISRHLARLMGGDLSLSSIPGKGSRFTLNLPEADRP